MSATIDAGRGAGLAARVAHASATAWQRLTPRSIALVVAACLAWSTLELAAPGIASLPRRLVSEPGINNLLSMLLNGIAVFLAVAVADAMDDAAGPRWLPYVVAVATGVAAGSSLTWFVSQHVLGFATAYAGTDGHEGFATFVYRHGVGRFAILGLATYIHASRRDAARRVAAMRALQLGHADLERRVLASRLAAMRARIDPEAVLARLEEVEALYPADPLAADGMLKALAADLRAAIPRADE
jgi:hypothetical protein